MWVGTLVHILSVSDYMDSARLSPALDEARTAHGTDPPMCQITRSAQMSSLSTHVWSVPE